MVSVNSELEKRSMKTVMLLTMGCVLLAAATTVSARPVGQSPYAPAQAPMPYYTEPPQPPRQVPDVASTGLLLGIAAASLAAVRRKWHN